MAFDLSQFTGNKSGSTPVQKQGMKQKGGMFSGMVPSNSLGVRMPTMNQGGMYPSLPPMQSGGNIRTPQSPNPSAPLDLNSGQPMGNFQGSIGPSIQGMDQLLQRMRGRNTGFSGRM